jgi:hypothetical protein
MAVYTDDFNRPDGLPDLFWARQVTYTGTPFPDPSDTLKIRSNALQFKGGLIGYGFAGGLLLVSGVVARNVIQQAVMMAYTALLGFGFAVRVQPGSTPTNFSGYLANFNASDGAQFGILRCTNSDLTQLTITNADIILSLPFWSSGTRRLEAIGPRLEVFQNDVSLGSVVDATYASGLFGFAHNRSHQWVDFQVTRVDDYTARTLDPSGSKMRRLRH